MELINGLINKIKLRQAEIVDSMVNGRFVNFESYQRYVGQHQGFDDPAGKR